MDRVMDPRVGFAYPTAQVGSIYSPTRVGFAYPTASVGFAYPTAMYYAHNSYQVPNPIMECEPEPVV
jgi:hypothetical protein